MESTGVASGCGCKEVYRFHHNYLSLLLLYLLFFAVASLLFVHVFKCFSFLLRCKRDMGPPTKWGPRIYIPRIWGPQKSPNL